MERRIEMKRHASLTLAAATLIAAAATASAGEFTARARVVKVVPLGEPVAIEVQSTCATAKPDRHDGLAATLRWDLCPTTAAAQPGTESGYRVYYEWDDRIYDRVMPRAPGATVPVRVSLD